MSSSSLSISTIILEYVCPCAGMIFANLMFTAPLRDLQTAVRQGQLGVLNPTPWAFMLGNCFGWCLYGTLRVNFWVYFANAPGFLCSVWLNLGAVKLLYQQHHGKHIRNSLVQYLDDQLQQQNQQEHDDEIIVQIVTTTNNTATPKTLTTTTSSSSCHDPIASSSNNKQQSPTSTTTTTTTPRYDWARIVWDVTSQTTPAPTPHERLVLVIVLIWMAMTSIVGFAGSTMENNNSNDTTKALSISLVGYLVNFNLVFFYGAPLSTIWQVLKTKCTASIHIPTLITNTMNASFWLAYGLAVLDAFIIVPNGLGAVLGGIQVVLLLLFPRRQKVKNDNENEIMENDDPFEKVDDVVDHVIDSQDDEAQLTNNDSAVQESQEHVRKVVTVVIDPESGNTLKVSSDGTNTDTHTMTH